MRLTFRVITTIGVILLCSCATQDSLRLPLPAETAIAKGTGRKDWLHLTLRLESGRELLFEVDTGAPVTVFDTSLEPSLGKRVKARNLTYAWKETTAGVYRTPKVYLGGTQLVIGNEVWTDDLSRSSSVTNPDRPIMGILGMDCLRHYCIQLDFEAGRMRFLNPEHLKKEGLGRAFPLTSSSGHVIVRETFTGTKNVNMIVDTGCLVDGILEPREFQRLLQQHRAAWTNQYDDPTGMRRCTALFPKAVFGGETYTNLHVDRCPLIARKGRHFYLNAIGLPFLARHLVTLDFPGRTMYLKRTDAGPLTATAVPPQGTVRPTRRWTERNPHQSLR